MFIAVPFAAVFMIAAALLMLACWPIVPLFCYFERRSDYTDKNFNE
jgi:hypothetical protein